MPPESTLVVPELGPTLGAPIAERLCGGSRGVRLLLPAGQGGAAGGADRGRRLPLQLLAHLVVILQVFSVTTVVVVVLDQIVVVDLVPVIGAVHHPETGTTDTVRQTT